MIFFNLTSTGTIYWFDPVAVEGKVSEEGQVSPAGNGNIDRSLGDSTRSGDAPTTVWCQCAEAVKKILGPFAMSKQLCEGACGKGRGICHSSGHKR